MDLAMFKTFDKLAKKIINQISIELGQRNINYNTIEVLNQHLHKCIIAMKYNINIIGLLK